VANLGGFAKPIMILSFLIIVLSVAGLANALYFTLAYYGRVKKARWVPEILCAREGSSCVTVVGTPYARVFGVPNSLLGIIYYILVIVWAAGTPWRHGFSYSADGSPVPFGFSGLIVFASGLTAVLGLYLIYALRRKLHTHCPLCYLGHGINALLLVLVVLRCD
jgi:uncharacterized membrane protein